MNEILTKQAIEQIKNMFYYTSMEAFKGSTYLLKKMIENY